MVGIGRVFICTASRSLERMFYSYLSIENELLNTTQTWVGTF